MLEGANRPKLRIVDSLDVLAGLIHPDLFGAYLAVHKQAFLQVG